MNVLIIGLNYAPEPVGIGPYTAGMAEALAEAGHTVTVLCAKPYYPAWSVMPAYRGFKVQRSRENGVSVVRLPIYVPRQPDGKRRLLHHCSFVAALGPAVAMQVCRARPDVVIGIAPSLLSVAVARLTAHLLRAPLWLHVQDFEVGAAFATGLLASRGALARLACAFERWSLRADRVSTISPQMCAGLAARGVAGERIVEFRNWTCTDTVRPLSAPSLYRSAWRIDRPHVAVYAGTLANKQGIELVIAAARRLRHRRDLAFVICGEGPRRAALVDAAADLDNVWFHPLQPRERLSELLGLASVHLLPQIAGAADLVLPSKLTNMLASGRPIIAAAAPNTGLAREIEGCGLVVPPGEPGHFAEAIERLIDDPQQRRELGEAARARAEARWSRTAILTGFQRQLHELAGPRMRSHFVLSYRLRLGIVSRLPRTRTSRARWSCP